MVLAFWAFLCSFWMRPPAPRAEPPIVSILCYHTFDSAKKTPYTVSSARFREQMRFLSVQRVPVIPLSRLVSHLREGTPLPDHSVVITLDDGYRTARTKAWPLLREFGFPFTLFVYPHFIGCPSALSWEDLRVLSENGVDIQSHSMTHPLLTHPPKSMTRKDYLAWLDAELAGSKRRLEARLGKPVTVLAYPFGGYDERVVKSAQKAGYQAALTCDDGNVDHLTDPFHLNRRLVYRRVKAREFADYFSYRTLQVEDLLPRDGERVRKPLSEIRGRIVNIKDVVPESVKIFIDKVGRRALPVAVDPQNGEFRFALPTPHKKGYYFVSLFALDRTLPNLHREASWIFIISRNTSNN